MPVAHRTHHPIFALACASLAFFLLWGCSGGDGNSNTGTEPTPAFTMQASPSSLTVQQGAAGTVTISVNRSGGFAGGVAVSVQGLPQGVTASALNVAGGSNSGDVTLTVGPQAATGTATLTFRGTGSGVTERTAQVTLTVQAAPTPDFGVSLAPGALSVQAGSSGEVAVSLSRSGGFTGAVALSATGLPSGVSATFAPSAPSGAGGNASTLTLQAGSGAAAGTVQVEVVGTADGVGTRSATLNLTVTAAPPPSGQEVSLVFCGVSGIPVWVAYRDGTGPWTRATGTEDRYTVQISEDRGSVAWVVPEADDGFAIHVLHATRAELQGHGAERCPAGAGAGKSLTGSVAGLEPFPVIESGFVSMGGVFAEPAPTSFTPAFSLTGVPNEPVDLLATAVTISPTTGSATPRKVILRRGLNPAPGSALPLLDFGSGEAFDPVTRSLTVTGLGPDQVMANSLFWSVGHAQNLTGFAMGAGATQPWYGIPQARTQNGDLHMVSATAAANFTTPHLPTRTTVRLMAQATDVTLPLGPALSSVTAAPEAGPGYRRARFTFAAQPEYDRFWFVSLQQGAAPARRTEIQMTRGYRGSGTGTVEMDVPDFSGVDGWNSLWGLREGVTIVWNVDAVGWTGGGTGLPSDLRQDGFEFRSATRMGEF